MADHKPLYRWSLQDAVTHNEVQDWRDSYRENCDCARAIERAIADQYHDNILENGTKDIIDRYGFDRVNWVLANTLQEKAHDGRFSQENKRWAKGFYIPRDDVRWHFCVESHPGLTDLFINQTREAWQKLGLFEPQSCISEKDGEIDYKGRLLVLKPTVLKESYRTSENQLFVAEGGFGCSPSDGRDFSFFKKENGIARLSKHLVSECSTASPFDYQNHTRMYIPEDMPAPDNKSDDYINAITESILRLIDATNGHTAILFTSYKVLQAVYERAIHQLGKYEVFCMTRNNRKVISDFRKSRNGVLFASGSMWEGVDCVGDGLSSVIIVRLPFPLRSAAMEQKKEAIGDVAKFVHEYAVPEMLIKLRQGVGRLIRCETDTGVISILDSRAANGSYVPRVKMALLKYPTVDSVEEVKSFMESVKGEDYYA